MALAAVPSPLGRSVVFVRNRLRSNALFALVFGRSSCRCVASVGLFCFNDGEFDSTNSHAIYFVGCHGCWNCLWWRHVSTEVHINPSKCASLVKKELRVRENCIYVMFVCDTALTT